jgi:hypothetical protein
MSITIPPRIIGYARESLCSQLCLAAEDIAEGIHEWTHRQPERYAEPVERFDRIRGVLEFVGWADTNPQQPIAITAPRDQVTLIEALTAQLATEQDMMKEDRGLRDAERQIKTAKRRARQIKKFLANAHAANGTAAQWV